MTASYDVAVVGCGPVGAMAANLLGHAGLRVLVLEAAEALHPLPRAVHIDHEIMRLLQGVGLDAALSPLMREGQGHLHIGADGGMIRYLSAAERRRTLGWAADYFFYQPEFEAALRAGLEPLANVELRQGARLEGLADDGDGVTLSIAQGGVQRVETARYVIGCDGARSAVRQAVGVALEDLDFEEPWLVVDAEVDGPIHFPDFAGVPEGADLQSLSVMLCDPRRPATVVPGRGALRRWEFMLLPGEDDRAMIAPEVVDALVRPWVGEAPFRILRAATYRFHGLVAERWRVGRVVLAGDAAHQTPPFFGQGMCHGLRDVANLAWKLALVVKGEADDALLDSYAPERDPQVRAVIAAAVNAGRYICELDPAKAAERDRGLRAAMASPATMRSAADLITPYAQGVVRPGCGERFVHPQVVTARGGRRLLDAVTGGGFRLFTRGATSGWRPDAAAGAVLSRAAIQRWPLTPEPTPDGLVDVDGVLGEWLDAKGADAVLLRPDAYVYGVARTGAELDVLLGQLGEDLHLSLARMAPLESALCPA